jgi:predicted lysophospholipase L1 biosynthesis ABC-type transport system permease subunit
VFLNDDTERRVIGVVADARTERFDMASPSFYEGTGPFAAVLVRNDGAAVAATRDIIRRLDPRAAPAVVEFVPALEGQLRPSVSGAAVAMALAGVALLLACIGILGVVSYIVRERVREIGIRLAIGARPADIVRLVAGRMSMPLAGGLLSGCVVALAAGRTLTRWLHGTSPYDPVVYIVVIVIVAVSTAAAAAGPVSRALRVDPAATLRQE